MKDLIRDFLDAPVIKGIFLIRMRGCKSALGADELWFLIRGQLDGVSRSASPDAVIRLSPADMRCNRPECRGDRASVLLGRASSGALAAGRAGVLTRCGSDRKRDEWR